MLYVVWGSFVGVGLVGLIASWWSIRKIDHNALAFKRELGRHERAVPSNVFEFRRTSHK